MKLAIAGDSAGEGLAKVLADHLKDKHQVSEISRTDEGPDAFYANLSDRVASQVKDGTFAYDPVAFAGILEEMETLRGHGGTALDRVEAQRGYGRHAVHGSGTHTMAAGE